MTQLASWMGAVSDPGARATLPAEVGDVVRERVGRLPEPAAKILSDASILGTELDIDGLTAVTGLDASATVLDGLAPALAAGLLVRDDLPGRWRFVHGVVSETLRSHLGPDRSARLHLSAAQGLRDSNGGRPGPHLSALAAHLVDAAPLVDRDEVVAALAAAAGWNAEHLAFEQAFGQVERALEVVGRMPEGEARDSAELDVQGLRAQLILTTSGYGTAGARRDVPADAGAVRTAWKRATRSRPRCCGGSSSCTPRGASSTQQWTSGRRSPRSTEAPARRSSCLTWGWARPSPTGATSALPGSTSTPPSPGSQTAGTGLGGVVAETPEVWIAVFSAWNRWHTGDSDGAEREVLAAVELAAEQGELTYAHTFAHWFSGLIAVLRQDAGDGAASAATRASIWRSGAGSRCCCHSCAPTAAGPSAAPVTST